MPWIKSNYHEASGSRVPQLGILETLAMNTVAVM